MAEREVLPPAKGPQLLDIAQLTQNLRLTPIAGAFRPMSNEQADQLEAVLGTELPADYRAFVQHYGRCGLDGDVDIVPLEGPHLSILKFFGAPQPGRADDVFWHLETLRDELPTNCFAIGDDGFGNPFVLDALSGRVVFLDHDLGFREPRAVAPTFSDFLRRIVVTPDD